MREPADKRSALLVRHEAKYVVSDDHEFVYFVIQKAACTSIKTALLPLFDIDPAAYGVRRKRAALHEAHRLLNASGYLIDKDQFVAELDGRYRDYFKFTFVRNPWDRLVSCYSEKVVDSDEGLKMSRPKGVRLGRGTSFAEFVERVCDISDDEANVHFRSQYKMVCGPEDDGPIMADFVGRFENLAADFAVAAERIGGDRKPELPHKHRSKSREARHYVEFYDDRLRDLVGERFKRDVELFGYSFGAPDVPPALWPISRRPPRDEAEGLEQRNRGLERTVEMLRKRNHDLEHELRSAKEQIRRLGKNPSPG